MHEVLRQTVLAVSAFAAFACSDNSPTEANHGASRIRVFNAVVNLHPELADEVDILVDSSTALPGAAALLAGTGSDYHEIRAGAHSFLARLVGDERPGGQSNLLGFDARATIAAGFDYSLYVIGVVPDFDPPDVEPLLVVDDPFPPTPMPDGSGLRARIKLINAAPYAAGSFAGSGTTLRLFVTSAAEPPPADVSGLAASRSASYRRAASDLELPAGRYVLTVGSFSGVIVAQAELELDPGQARSLVVLSREQTSTPGPANHAIVTLRDADF